MHSTKTTLPPVIGRDYFAGRAVLKGYEAVASVNNEQGSVETDEPEHTPNQQNVNTKWWTWTAPSDGQVTFNTRDGVSSAQAIALSVYTGSELSGLMPVMQGTADIGSVLGFGARSGVVYQIVANGYGPCAGQTGFNLRLHSLHPDPEVKQ